MKIMYTWIMLLIFSTMATLDFGQTSYPFADQLCYTESFVEKIKVTTQLNTATLTLQDKIRFKEKKYLKNHFEYLKKGNYPVHEVRYRSWTKIFPKWYRVADIIRTDETGVRSYFTSDNQYIPGGWSGSTYTSTENGYYSGGDGPKEGRFYHENHTVQSATAYQLHKQSTEVFGLLANHRFFIPTPQMLTALSTQGYTVLKTATFIQVSNETIRITWGLTEKCITREYRKQQNVLKTIITKYKYVASIGQELKFLETEITPDQLENGNCVDIITETTFTDYSLDCAGTTDFRGDSTFIQNDRLNIFPNPVNDLITVFLKEYSEGSKITISSMTGHIMYSGPADNVIQIDVSTYAPGLYIASAIQGAQIMSTKFIKL